MADEVVIRFKADGGNLDATLRQLRDELGKLGNSNAPKSLRDTSAATTQLAQALNSSYKSAQQFSQQLGLTAQKSAEAVTKLRDLDRVGATNVEKFRALSREMGITRQQFDQLNVAAGKSKEGLQGLAVASGAIAAGLGAIAVKGVQDFAAFDQSVRTFGVVTESSGTTKVNALRVEVERLAAATTKTPQEIANVATELAKAGFSAEQTKIALAGVVQSSEATGEGLVRTGEVIGQTLNQFGLSADKSLKIADLLTQASNASAAGTNDLGEALSYVGAQAKASNQSVEDTVTTLALLANGGIKGSSAGTGLAEALRRLKVVSASANTELADLRAKGMKQAIAAFDRLNEEVRNSDGTLKPFPEIIRKLKQQLSTLDEGNKDLVLNALFGVQGGRVVQTLLQQTDAQVSQVTTSMANFEGSSKRASQELTKGLGGSLKLFESSLQLSTQKIGEFLSVGLEPLVRGAATLLNGFIALPAPIQGIIIGVGALTGALAAATAVLTAYQLLNVATTASLALKTAATIASTVATGASASAQLLFNTQITITQARLVAIAAAQGIATIAQQAYALATGAATTAIAGFSTALLTVVAPLAVLGAGIALVGLVKLTEQLSDANNRLEELRTSTDAVLGSGLSAESKLKAAIDARNAAKQKGIELTNEQVAAEQRASKQADGQLQLLKQQLEAAEKDKGFSTGIGGLDQVAGLDAQKNAREANIASIKQQIETLEKQKEALKGVGEADKAANNKPNADGKKDKAQIAQEKTEAKADRSEDKAKAAAAFQDAQQQKEQAFQDQKQQKEQAFNDAKQAKEQAFQDQQTAREQAFQDQKQTRDQAFQDAQRTREQAFQDKQKADTDAFQEGQRLKTEAFNKKQQADQEAFTKKQSDEKAAFDKSISAEEKQINRNQQLRDADTPEAKANLRKQFREQDRNAAELAPLEAKRKAFEEKQKAEAKAEEEKRKAEAKVEEDKRKEEQKLFEAQQKEETRLFQEAQRKLEADFKLQERELERKFKADQQDQERKFKADQQAADRAFKLQEQAADRAFKDEQRAADRAFKEQEREFDLETARQVKAIKADDKPTNESKPNSQPGIKQGIQGRKLGGPVDGGSLYQVGEAGPEYFVPSTSGYVINHSESIALAREALSGGRVPVSSAAIAPSLSNSAILSELRATRKVMEKIESREPALNVPVTFEGQKAEANFDRFYRLQRAMYRGAI